jgi:hypothetical protein
MPVELRDDFAGVLGDAKQRRRLHSALRSVEREALGLPVVDTSLDKAKYEQRLEHFATMALPKEAPASVHSGFLRGPRSRRGDGRRSGDAMFQIDPQDAAEGVSSFWLYGTQKLTQRTLGNSLSVALALGGLPVAISPSTAPTSSKKHPMSGPGAGLSRSVAHHSTNRPATSSTLFMTALDDTADDGAQSYQQRPTSSATSYMPTEDEVRARVHAEFITSPLAASLRRRVDSLMSIAASRRRCGLLFDLVSTANIIRSGVPHLVGEYLYEYLATQHNDKLAVKFAFVGISDNVNCCAARDVLCRDDTLNGVYIGDTKRREFDALDNIHVFAVFPRVPNPNFATFGGTSSATGQTRIVPPGSPNATSSKDAAARAAHLTFLLKNTNPDAQNKKLLPPTKEELAQLACESEDEDEANLAEHHPKISLDMKKRLFDRREWGFFARPKSVSDLRPIANTPSVMRPPPAVRAASATPNAPLQASTLRSRSALSMTPAGSVGRRPASLRGDAIGLGAVDFPPGLAAALRSFNISTA